MQLIQTLRPLVIACVSVCGAALHAGPMVGRVIDSSGESVGYADIRVFSPAAISAATDIETDINGEFRIELPSAGPFRIEIVKSGFMGARFDVLEGNESPRRLVGVLARPGTISGRVEDGSGRPMEGTRVFAEACGAAELDPVTLPNGYSMRADSQTGAYQLHDLIPGKYLLGVEYGSGSAAAISFYPTADHPQPQTIGDGQDLRGINFSVTPARSFQVTGIVPASVGSSYNVTLVSAMHPSIALGRVRTGADGTFSFAGVAPGHYLLLAFGPIAAMTMRGGMVSTSGRFGRAEIEVVDTDLTNVSITLQDPVKAELELRQTEPVRQPNCSSPMKLRLTPVENWGAISDKVAQIALGRRVTQQGLAPGLYYARVEDPAGACVQQAEVQINVGHRNSDAPPITIPIVRAGSIGGAIAAHASGTLVVRLINPDHFESPGVAQACGASRSCRFFFGSLRGGHYTIEMSFINDDKNAQAIRKVLVPVELGRGQDMELNIDAAVLIHSRS